MNAALPPSAAMLPLKAGFDSLQPVDEGRRHENPLQSLFGSCERNRTLHNALPCSSEKCASKFLIGFQSTRKIIAVQSRAKIVLSSFPIRPNPRIRQREPPFALGRPP